MTDWQPIDTAPTDKPVWVYYDHDEDRPDPDGELSPYGFYAAAGLCKVGKGQCEAIWGDAVDEDEGGEGFGPFTEYPAWWFADNGEEGIAVNATHWRPLPPPPTT